MRAQIKEENSTKSPSAIKIGFALFKPNCDVHPNSKVQLILSLGLYPRSINEGVWALRRKWRDYKK